MKFADLRKMTLLEFLDQSPRGDAFWFFQHVPKTAGSSFSAELAATAAPYHNIHVDYTRTDIPYLDRFKASVEEFISRPDLTSFKSASGHLPLGLTRRLSKTIPNAQMVTILRNPVERVISEYRYQRSELHPVHEAFKAKYPTVENYIEDSASQNQMARYVVGRNASRDVAVHELENHFAFAGLLEMYPMTFSVIFDLMGFPGRTPVEHQRKTPDNKDTEVELTLKLVRRIRELNSVDGYLFEHVRDVLAPHRDDWLKHLSESRNRNVPASTVPA